MIVAVQVAAVLRGVGPRGLSFLKAGLSFLKALTYGLGEVKLPEHGPDSQDSEKQKRASVKAQYDDYADDQHKNDEVRLRGDPNSQQAPVRSKHERRQRLDQRRRALLPPVTG